MAPNQPPFKRLRNFFTASLRSLNSVVPQAGRASGDRAPERDGQPLSQASERRPDRPAIPETHTREYQKNVGSLDDPNASGDVARWAVKTIEEQERGEPGRCIAESVLGREAAEFSLTNAVDGRLYRLMEDFQRARYRGDAPKGRTWNLTLMSEYMEGFAKKLQIEPCSAVDPAELPGDAPSAYGSAAHPEPRTSSEWVVTWHGARKRSCSNPCAPGAGPLRVARSLTGRHRKPTKLAGPRTLVRKDFEDCLELLGCVRCGDGEEQRV
jgi:hypothetical protein